MAERSKEFDSERKGKGTAEWAEVNENICIGCPNDCLYCYAAANAKRYKRRERDKWHIEEFSKRAEMKSYPARDGIIMFPSTHDITPFNVDEYIRCATMMLEKGNRLLIVTKPNPDCIDKMLLAFTEYKSQILFRFTIGTLSDTVSKFWEPGAPLPFKRIACLDCAKSCGYQTSVAIEPMLSGVSPAEYVVRMVAPAVTDTIWIGKMNRVKLRVDMSIPANVSAVYSISNMQSDKEITNLYNRNKNNPKIRWKDSIREVIARPVLKIDTGYCPYDEWSGKYFRIHFGTTQRCKKGGE